MANLLVLDGAGAQKYVAKTGAGTNGDPFVDPATALPTGAATSAQQIVGNDALTSILAAVSGAQAVTGPLTDAELRAVPVPVSGTVTTTGLTDAQLRATPVPVSGTVTATVTGAATSAKQDTLIAAVDGLEAALAGTLTVAPSTRTLLTVTGTRSTSGDGTAVIAAPSAGNHVTIVNLEVNPSEATVTIILKSGSTAKRTWTLAQNSLYANDYPRGHELRMGSAAAVYLNLSGDSDTNYAIDYFLEAD